MSENIERTFNALNAAPTVPATRTDPREWFDHVLVEVAITIIERGAAEGKLSAGLTMHEATALLRAYRAVCAERQEDERRHAATFTTIRNQVLIDLRRMADVREALIRVEVAAANWLDRPVQGTSDARELSLAVDVLSRIRSEVRGAIATLPERAAVSPPTPGALPQERV